MGITTKRIRGVDYLYFTRRDRDANATRFRSCGPAHTPEAQLRALELEYARLEQLQSETAQAMKEMRARIDALRGAAGAGGQ